MILYEEMQGGKRGMTPSHQSRHRRTCERMSRFIVLWDNPASESKGVRTNGQEYAKDTLRGLSLAPGGLRSKESVLRHRLVEHRLVAGLREGAELAGDG